MRHLALIVEYESHPEHQDDFDKAIRAHAKACVEEEPGCLRFEVLRPLGEDGAPIANRFMASEIFTDEAALASHLATPRWQRMSVLFGEWLVSRKPVLSEVQWDE